MFEYPFEAVVGEGLGISQSTFAKQVSILPGKQHGIAKLLTYTNLLTGNLYLQDHMSEFVERGGLISLGYVYNSHAKKNEWRLPYPELLNPSDQAEFIQYVAEDGHVTRFKRYEDSNEGYFSTECVNGLIKIKFNKAQNIWESYNLDTGIREYFNAHGQLVRRTNAQGGQLEFQYDAQGRLVKIIPNRQRQYIIERRDNIVEFYVESENNRHLIKKSLFDTEGRLLSTTLDELTIQYAYLQGTMRNYVRKISQTMKGGVTVLSRQTFDYKKVGSETDFRVNRVQDGDPESGNYFTFNFVKDGVVEIGKSVDQLTRIQVDTAARLLTVVRQNTFWRPQSSNPTRFESETYSFTLFGQLDTVTKANGAQVKYLYDENNLLRSRIGAENEVSDYLRDLQTGVVRIKVDYAEESFDEIGMLNRYATRFIHDLNFKGNNRFLRFRISATGTVTEYRPNEMGDVASQRIYLSQQYSLSTLKSDETPTLGQMEEWAARQNQSMIALTEYEYDDRAQTTRVRNFSNISSAGVGQVDADMSQTETHWDGYGNLLSRLTLQSDQETIEERRQYDSYQRLLNTTLAPTRPIEQTSGFQYQDTGHQQTTILPNNSRVIKTKDSSGAVISVETVVNANNAPPAPQQSRTTNYLRDTIGRLFRSELSDGHVFYHCYDQQGREIFKISSLGQVTQIYYAGTENCQVTIKYARQIDMSSINEFPELPITAQTVAQLIVEDTANDRYEYQIFDGSGQLCFFVDPENYLIEFRYDQRGKKIAEIQYSERLSSQDLLLLHKKQLKKKYDVTQDRVTFYFYDDETRLVGQQDPGGYVKEYVLDAFGNRTKEIIYFAPTPHSLDFEVARPEKNARDINRYRYYDLKGQCVAEVDAERYLTRYQYFANGKIKEVFRCANPVSQDPTQTSNWRDFHPSSHPEDQITQYQYDELGRQTRVVLPSSAQHFLEYDEMNHVTTEEMSDMLDQEDNRSTLRRFDGWSQLSAMCSPRVAQKLKLISGNTSLAGEERASQTESVWRDESRRYVYDPSNGLKIKTIDELGNVTLHFYDELRREKYLLNASGSLIEKAYNTFNEVVVERRYFKKLSSDHRASLSPGVLQTADLQILQSLRDSENDAERRFQFDRRGLLTATTDPEGFSISTVYDAFRQKCEVYKPSHNAEEIIKISRAYDLRGNQISKVESCDGIYLRESSEFQHPLNKLTQHRDRRGGAWQFEYDRLGRQAEITDPIGAVTLKSFDAFGRLQVHTDPTQRVTRHMYDQGLRTHTIVHFGTSNVVMTREIRKMNAFGEVDSETDGLSNTHSKVYGPDGQIEVITDALGNSTRNYYLLNGLRDRHERADGVATRFQYDADGRLIHRVADVDGRALTTSLTYDGIGHIQAKTNPRGVITLLSHDRRGLVIKTVVDASEEGINLTTIQHYNPAGGRDQITKGDQSNADQRTVEIIRDPLNREVGQKVDPRGLKLFSQQIPNDANDIVMEIDAEGREIYHVYDLLGQKRFVINPESYISEWRYDEAGREKYYCIYAKSIDLTQLPRQRDIAAISQLISDQGLTDANADKRRYKFYDVLGRLRFIVNGLGVVTEKFYDLCSREIATTRYATLINSSMLDTFNTDTLAAAVVRQPDKDRTIRKILSARGKERFLIDAEAYITEHVFDVMGRVIMTRAYSTRIEDPVTLAQMKDTEVNAQLVKDFETDRIAYYSFDATGKPEFVIDPEGGVTRYDHDEMGNVVSTIEFNSPLQLSDGMTYSAVITLARALQPDSGVDRIHGKSYDNANRKIKDTDSLGNDDAYVIDALGQVVSHTDRVGAVWRFEYDKAGRKVREISPSSNLALVSPREVASNGATQIVLNVTESNSTVIQEMQYDKVGNQVLVISAKGLTDERRVSFHYSKLNQITETLFENATVDNPGSELVFRVNGGVKSASLSKQTNFNSLGLVVRLYNENAKLLQKFYDAEGQLIFELDSMSGLKAFEYNAFGEVVGRTRLSNYHTFPRSPSMQVLKERLDSISSSAPEDLRVTTFQFDRRGKKTVEKSPSVFYYLPLRDEYYRYEDRNIQSEPGIVDPVNNPIDVKNPVMGVASPTVKYVYDAFAQVRSKQILHDPQAQRYHEYYYWYSKTGSVRLTVDPVFRVIHFQYSSFGENILRREYALPLGRKPGINIGLLALFESVQQLESSNDRVYRYDYDVRGDLIQRTLTALVYREESDSPAQIETTQQAAYQYDARQHRVSQTSANGGVEYTYYDARGLVIGLAGAKRSQFSDIDDENPANVIPFTRYWNNAHGQQVKITHYAASISNPVVGVFPTAEEQANDQTVITLFDSRGLQRYQERSGYSCVGFTYTPTAKLARKYIFVVDENESDHEEGGLVKTYRRKQYVDEQRYKYDSLDRRIETKTYRDGVLQLEDGIFVKRYNPVGEVIFEATPIRNNAAAIKLLCRYDQTGHLVYTNGPDGVNKIYAYDLAGRLTLQCTANDLIEAASLLRYSNDPLAFFRGIGRNYIRFERTEKLRDAVGRLSILMGPARAMEPTVLHNLPLTIAVKKDDQTVSWRKVSSENMKPLKATLLARFNRALSFELPIVSLEDERQGILIPRDRMSTDTYEYQIDYAVGLQTYRAQGFVQIDTGNAAESSTFVVYTEPDGKTVRLAGNVPPYSTSLELYRYQPELSEGAVATLSIVERNTGSETYPIVDLSSQPSGEYKFKLPNLRVSDPNFFDLPDQSETKFTCRFNVYTDVPANRPLSQQISVNVDFQFYLNYGRVSWDINPPNYNQAQMRVYMRYLDPENVVGGGGVFLFRGDTIGNISDQAGTVFPYNLVFTSEIRLLTLLRLTINIKNRWVEVFNYARLQHEIQNSSDEQVVSIQSVPLAAQSYIYISGLSDVPPIITDVRDRFNYYDLSLDTNAVWRERHLYPVFDERNKPVSDALEIKVDTRIFTGRYKFRYGQESSPRQASAQGQFFDVGQKYYVYQSDDVVQFASPAMVRKRKSLEYDAWNNVVNETDSLGHVTSREYNALNKAIKIIEPPVRVYDELGNDTLVRPTTHFVFNAMGMAIAMIDPQGHTVRYVVDEAGQRIKTILADGALQRFSMYDSFGREFRWRDGLDNSEFFTQTFDQMNHVTSLTGPVVTLPDNSTRRIQVTTKYDQHGNRVQHAVSDVSIYRYRFDALNNMIDSFSPMGHRVTMTYDRTHQLLTKKAAVIPTNATDAYDQLLTATWVRDSYFGTPRFMTDFSGNRNTYVHDGSGRLTYEQRAGRGSIYPFTPNAFQHNVWAASVPQPNHIVRYSYEGGVLVKHEDVGNFTRTIYKLDAENRRIAMFVTLTKGDRANEDLVVLQQLHTEYDAHSRPIWIADTDMSFEIGYDAVGNRRFVRAWQGESAVKAFGYAYDVNNRVLINNGRYQSGLPIRIISDEKDSMALTYNGPYRMSQMQKTQAHGSVTSTFSYYGDGLLYKATDSTGAVTVRKYDQAQRLVTLAVDDRDQFRATYNANGWMVSGLQGSTGINIKPSSSDKPNTAFLSTGQPFRVNLGLPGGVDLVHSYQITSVPLETQIVYQQWTDAPTPILAWLHKKYDTLNRLQSTENEREIVEANTGHHRTDSNWKYRRFFQYDPHGHVILKHGVEYNNGTINHTMTRYYYTMAGELLASVTPGSWPPSNNAAVKRSVANNLQIHISPVHKVDQHYPPPNPGTYLAHPGETYSQISQAVYGTSEFADDIARLNNDSGADTAVVNTSTIQLPQEIVSMNDVHTSVVYQRFTSVIIGRLFPSTFKIKMPKPHHHHWWESVIEIFASVLLSIALPGVGTALMKALDVTINAFIRGIGFAVEGAMISASQQGLAIGFGDQQRFSWLQVGRSAFEFGFGGGITHSAAIGGRISMMSFVPNLLSYGALAATEQLAEMALGLRKKFDMRDVAYQAGVNAAMDSINSSYVDDHGTSHLYINNMWLRVGLGVVARNVLASAIYHRPIRVEVVAAQYLGNMALEKYWENNHAQGSTATHSPTPVETRVATSHVNPKQARAGSDSSLDAESAESRPTFAAHTSAQERKAKSHAESAHAPQPNARRLTHTQRYHQANAAARGIALHDDSFAEEHGEPSGVDTYSYHARQSFGAIAHADSHDLPQAHGLYATYKTDASRSDFQSAVLDDPAEIDVIIDDHAIGTAALAGAMSAMGTMGAALPGLVGMTQAISAANAHPRTWNHASSIAEPKWHAGSSDKAKQDIADDEISNYAIRQQSFVQQMSEFVWQHQDEGWAKALMMTLTGFNEVIHSPVGEALVGGLVRDERVNPLVSGTEMMTSTDPYTGLPVDRLPAGVDFVFGVANLFSDGLASGIAAGMPRASAGLRSAGGWVSNRYGVFFGGQGNEIVRPRLISRIDRISSNVANGPFISEKAVAAGWKPPYPADVDIRELTLSQEVRFARVFTENDPSGQFLVRYKEIADIIDDPEAIRVHLGLRNAPTNIADVYVPADTKLFVGRIGEQPNFGLMSRGGFQYQLEGWIPPSSFQNIRPLQQELNDDFYLNFRK